MIGKRIGPLGSQQDSNKFHNKVSNRISTWTFPKTKRAVLKDLYERIRGDDYYENQVKLLKKDVCPFFLDREKCESEVDMNWKYFSEGLFTNDSADDFCTYPDNNCDTEKYVDIF